MKDLIPKIGLLLIILFIIACAKQEVPAQLAVPQQDITYNSVNDISQQHLDEKFNIPEEIYDDFLTNAVFIDNQLRGLKYTGIEGILEDSESNEFWAYFGFSIRSADSPSQYVAKPRPVYMNKKPITGGCQPDNEFVCFGQGANDIQNHKPITGGCQEAPNWVCFVPNDDG